MTLSFFDELVCETAMELARFRSVPLVLRGVTTGVDRDLYLDVLAGTYHTQRQTNRLTEQAISRCGEADSLLESWLRAILVAEKNQEDRILDDIRVLGGDPNRVQRSQPPRAVVAMATYAGDAIEQSSPYVLLGMRHVLNCVSLILARTAENTMRARLEADHAATGFAYFLSLGQRSYDDSLKFALQLDEVDTPERRTTAIRAAKRFFPLFGEIFLGINNPQKVWQGAFPGDAYAIGRSAA